MTSFQPSHRFGNLIRQMEPDKRKYSPIEYLFQRSYGFYAARLTKPIFDREKFLRVLENESERLVIVSPG